MAYSEKEKRKELGRLADFLNSVEIAAQVVEKGPYAQESSLLLCLPSAETPEGLTEENAPQLLHLATANLVDLEDPEPKIVKYLSLYSQVKTDLTGLEELEILRLLNHLNRAVRVGHFFYGEENGQRMVQYRAAVMGDAEKPLDEGVVANAAMEMGIGYDQMKDALEELQKERRGSGA